MRSIATLLAGLLLIALGNAHAHHPIFRERPKRHVSTITHKSLVTSIVTAPLTIDTDIPNTGIYTLIPGALTMTFNDLPAYVYIETVVATKSVITFQFITTSQVISPSPTNIQSVISSVTNSLPSPTNIKPVIDSISSNLPSPISVKSNTKPIPTIKTEAPGKSGTKTPSKTPTSSASATQSSSACCRNNGYTVAKDARCDGLAEGSACGSFHTCYQGGCYWFNVDDMCGSFNNACNTDSGYRCAGGTCTNVLNDPNNCGLAYRVCGDDQGNPYGCSQGVCVNLNSDPNNCGTVGKVCGTGKGCLTGKCIDTTSDDNNCSVPTYKCPSGTKCKDSWCQPK